MAAFCATPPPPARIRLVNQEQEEQVAAAASGSGPGTVNNTLGVQPAMVFNADVVRTSGGRDRQSESDGCTCTCSVPPDITAIYPKLREQNIDVLMGAFRSLGEHIVRLRTLLDLPLGARARVHQPTCQR